MRDQHQAKMAYDLGLSLFERGDLDAAVNTMRSAVVLYAAADAAASPDSSLRTLERSAACRFLGDLLLQIERFAEAANIYQQAIDQFARIDSEEAEASSRYCAGRILDCITNLRSRPTERLELLIERYELQLKLLATRSGTEREQAECSTHMARIYQRRARYPQAVAKYLEALRMYDRVERNQTVSVAIAECHHRLGNLFALRLDEAKQAIPHLKEAIALYAENEEVIYGEKQALNLCMRTLTGLEERDECR